MPAPDELLPQIYHELRKLAQAKLACENPGHTLNATALVHEAYLRLVRAGSVSDGTNVSVAHASGSVSFLDRSHFLRAAATAMRRILVDHARAKLTDKRGGGAQRVELGDVPAFIPDEQLLAVHAALDRLADAKPDHAKLIELRYFAGLSGDDAANVLGISPSTADRMWRYARAWLQVELQSA